VRLKFREVQEVADEALEAAQVIFLRKFGAAMRTRACSASAMLEMLTRLAARLLARLGAELGVDLAPETLVEAPTIVMLTAVIGDRLLAEEAGGGAALDLQ